MRLIPLKRLFHQKVPDTTTWMQRGEDRRKVSLGRKIDRRKAPDRRSHSQKIKTYEYVGLSLGGWTKVDDD